MLEKNPEALRFLQTRRSRPAKTLMAPAPSAAELDVLLVTAARVPDHGALVPFRFIVLEAPALRRFAGHVAEAGERLGKSQDDIVKAQTVWTTSPLAVAVIEVQRESEKIPAIEQTYTAGSVCLGLVNAALASGWGASWISGWASHDRGFIEQTLGLGRHETVAGFIHIGTESATPPERVRPDMAKITSWIKE